MKKGKCPITMKEFPSRLRQSKRKQHQGAETMTQTLTHSQQPRGLISAFCVQTWEMSANLRHNTSAEMSQPNLYFHSPASIRALWTWERLSAVQNRGEGCRFSSALKSYIQNSRAAGVIAVHKVDRWVISWHPINCVLHYLTSDCSSSLSKKKCVKVSGVRGENNMTPSFFITVYFQSRTVVSMSRKHTVVPCHHAANARGQFEHVGHSGRVQQFVLQAEERTQCHMQQTE